MCICVWVPVKVWGGLCRHPPPPALRYLCLHIVWRCICGSGGGKAYLHLQTAPPIRRCECERVYTLMHVHTATPPPANSHSTGTCCQALSLPHWKAEGRGEKAQGHGLQGVDRPQSPTGSKGLQLGSTSPVLGTEAGGEGLWQIHFYFPAH